MYYILLFVSLPVSALLTWIFFPKPFGEFPLFGDMTTLIFIPAYFVLCSCILHIFMWKIKNRSIKLTIILIVLLLSVVSSVLLFMENYSQPTSCFFTFIGLIIGFFHFSIAEFLRNKLLN